MSATWFFDEQIRKNRSSRSINEGKERNCFFRLYIKTVIISSHPIYDVFTSESASWKEDARWMRCWIFFPTSWIMFSLIILTSSRIGYMCKTTWQKKTTPPPTTQWTFRIQSDATIKQIPRRPAVKSPINTINLWRCGCETGCAFRQWKSFFSMSQDFWYTV